MIKKKVVVVSKTGLHARPANALVKKAQQYPCAVEIGFRDKTYNAKSMLGVLAAGINCGMEIEIICTGDREAEACGQIVQLIEEGLAE